jgi:RimJ/RimL family protein N-acetyltransferase
MSTDPDLVGLTFTWLDRDDLKTLDPILFRHGWFALNPELSRALVAISESGQIVGFSAFQMLPHIEPHYVAIPYRGTGLSEELIRRMVEFLESCRIPEAYVIANNPHSEQLAKRFGMQLVTFPVFYKKGSS